MANGKQEQAAQVQKAQRDKGKRQPQKKDPSDYDFSVSPEVKRKAMRQAEIDTRGGLYSDRIKVDPFAPGYKFPADRKPTRRT